MPTPGDLLASAQAAGAQVRRKPAWQQLRERGIGGQGSAAANKATLAGMETAQPPVGAPATPPPPAPEPTRAVSELPMPFRSLRVGGTPTVAPPPPDTATGDGRDAGVMALRALRMGAGRPEGAFPMGAPAPPSPVLKPFETGGGAGGGGTQSVAPETPQGPPGGGSGFVGRPIGGSPPPFATEDTPPWAGLAALMAKPRFQPSGDLQQGAPDEPPQGAPGNETPPWLAGIGPFKARRPLGGLGGFGGGQSRVEPKEGSAY